MRDKLRDYVENLFRCAPPSAQNTEMKEEILQNALAHYDDLVAGGKSGEAAYNIAVAGIGDVSQLFEPAAGQTPEQQEASRRASGLLLAGAVMLYILCVLPVLLLQSTLGVCLMFVMAALATGIIIYRGKVYERYTKRDETMVEEFRQWKSGNEEESTLFKSVSSSLWMICLAVYFLVSFRTGAWYITWVVFLIAAALQGVVRAIFDLRK
jgi:hypothetical protein